MCPSTMAGLPAIPRRTFLRKPTRCCACCAVCCVLCAVCCVLCAVCCVLCAVCCVLCAVCVCVCLCVSVCVCCGCASKLCRRAVWLLTEFVCSPVPRFLLALYTHNSVEPVCRGAPKFLAHTLCCMLPSCRAATMLPRGARHVT